MADPLYDLLWPRLEAKSAGVPTKTTISNLSSNRPSQPSPDSAPQASTKYLSRLLSLSLTDLQQTEPQSLAQQSHSTLLSIQALSSRSHRSTTASSDRLSTLGPSLSSLERSIEELRGTIPALDEAAVGFAESYGRRGGVAGASKAMLEDDNTPVTTTSSASNVNQVLKARKESMLLARQADKLQDILELPSLLSASIAAAASSASNSVPTTGSSSAASNSAAATASNYTTTLDLHTHIRRLAILYPESPLIATLQTQAQAALHDMTSDLIASLRAPRIRLPAAIRTIGWLRRVVPQLTSNTDLLGLYCGFGSSSTSTSSTTDFSARKPSLALGPGPGGLRRGSFSSMGIENRNNPSNQSLHQEDIFPMLFLHARLDAYTAQVTALSPLRDLADQETEKRLSADSQGSHEQTLSSGTRRPSALGQATPSISGHQTERYLKRYVEIFREQSFATIQMYKNIFPDDENEEGGEGSVMRLPSALATFPMHLVSLLMSTLQTYLPNVTDSAARESLLMQVLYAANSLGRLGADFSMMIALLDLPSHVLDSTTESQADTSDDKKHEIEPEWARIIKKHRIQAARLDALAANQTK